MGSACCNSWLFSFTHKMIPRHWQLSVQIIVSVRMNSLSVVAFSLFISDNFFLLFWHHRYVQRKHSQWCLRPVLESMSKLAALERKKHLANVFWYDRAFIGSTEARSYCQKLLILFLTFISYYISHHLAHFHGSNIFLKNVIKSFCFFMKGAISY